VVLLFCGFQLPPPSSVCRMVPYSPTAQADCGVTKATEQRSEAVPRLCGFQLAPPSSVCRMVPRWPTAQPDCGVAKATDCKFAEVTGGRSATFCSNGLTHHLTEPNTGAGSNCGGAGWRYDTHVAPASRTIKDDIATIWDRRVFSRRCTIGDSTLVTL
jgi:hypothetical protein